MSPFFLPAGFDAFVAAMRDATDRLPLNILGYCLVDNNLHVLIRFDPEAAAGWSDEGVVRRWGWLFPSRDQSRPPIPVSNA